MKKKTKRELRLAKLGVKFSQHKRDLLKTAMEMSLNPGKSVYFMVYDSEQNHALVYGSRKFTRGIDAVQNVLNIAGAGNLTETHLNPMDEIVDGRN